MLSLRGMNDCIQINNKIEKQTMKKILFLLTAFMAVACSQVPEGEVNTVATSNSVVVGLPDTRTMLGDKVDGSHPVYWCEDDQLVINGAASTGVTIREDRKTAVFEYATAVLRYPFYMTYPYSEGSLCSADRATVVFAAEQNYVEGTFGSGYAPMCGYCEGGSKTTLKHLAGVLRFAVNGSTTITKIEVASNEVALAGEFDVNCQTGEIAAIDGKTSKTVTYVVNKALSTSEESVFYIVVPSGNLGRCHIMLSDNTGLRMDLGWNATNVKPGVIREFKPFTFKGGTAFELEGLPAVDDDIVVEETVIRAPKSNEIWYTNGSTTEPTAPYTTSAFNANIVSNTYNAAKECWIIKFDGDVTTIGDSAFRTNALTSVVLPEGLTSIGSNAFYNCKNLVSVTIPSTLVSVGARAFMSCNALKGVYISDLSAWCKIDFNNANSNPLNIANKLYLNNAEVTEVTIPSGITEVKNYTFCNCTSLTSVEIPASVNAIGDGAFDGCTALSSALIGNGVQSIGMNSFSSCTSLSSVLIPNSVITIGDSAFFGCTGIKSLTIGKSVDVIEDSAFSNCTSLTSVVIPDSVSTLGNTVFAFCGGLKSVTIGSGVTSVGDNVFEQCTSIIEFYGKFASADHYCLVVDNALVAFAAKCGVNEYTISDSVTSVGQYAMYGCTSLTKLTIPVSVESIDYSAFANCTSLKEVYCKRTTPPSLAGAAFSNTNSELTIYVPVSDDDSIINAYKNNDGWSVYESRIKEDTESFVLDGMVGEKEEDELKY